MTLTWTKQRPTEPGEYYVRYPSDNTHRIEWRVNTGAAASWGLPDLPEGELWRWVEGWPNGWPETPHDDRYNGCLWAGPIEIPPPPEEVSP